MDVGTWAVSSRSLVHRREHLCGLVEEVSTWTWAPVWPRRRGQYMDEGTWLVQSDTLCGTEPASTLAPRSRPKTLWQVSATLESLCDLIVLCPLSRCARRGLRSREQEGLASTWSDAHAYFGLQSWCVGAAIQGFPLLVSTNRGTQRATVIPLALDAVV